jgi:hypothetical protein
MTFDEREVENIPNDQLMDWILPDTIKFTMRTVQYDDLITHNFRFRDYPTVVTNAWGASFFNKIGTRVVMKLTPVERYKAVRQIDQSIDELREQEATTGKASKIMEVGTHIDTLAEVLRLLQGENEVLFNVCTYVQANDFELSEHMAAVESGLATKEKYSAFGFKKEVRRELAEEGFIKACAPFHAGFMGGGGNIEKFTNETGPQVAEMLKSEGVDACLLTAG